MELVIPSRGTDWSDCHSGPVRADICTARDAYEEGLAKMPGWAGAALAARNKVVSAFGLHTGGGVEGDLMAALPVRSETPDAYECGLTDRHLTFTILTELKGGQVSMTTSIWFNHWAGRAYLAVVLIPHKIIVKQCISRWREAMKLSAKAIDLIETWRLGFVATVSADGRPNVSPKGTFIVLDEETIAFGEMRSPNTMANLAHQAEVDVSFVDVLSRAGVRVRGEARIVGAGAEFDALAPHFHAIWGDELLTMFNVIIVIPCVEVKPLQSPVYETGAVESDLRAQWKTKIAGMPT